MVFSAEDISVLEGQIERILAVINEDAYALPTKTVGTLYRQLGRNVSLINSEVGPKRKLKVIYGFR